MKLHSQAYAFFDPATLFLYRDPFSPYKRVRDFIFFPPAEAAIGPVSYWASARKTLETLQPDEQRDLVLRLSSYAHERQHFHDMLLTHYGNSLVRSFFILGVHLSALIKDVIQKHSNSMNVVALPLQESDVQNPETLERARSTFDEYNQRLENARYTFEASAMITQTLAARDWFGTLGQEILKKSFQGSHLYDTLPAALDVLLTRILRSGHGVGIRHLRQILLFSLSTDEPDHTTLQAIIGLKDVADRLELDSRSPTSFTSRFDTLTKSLQDHASTLSKANSDFFLGPLDNLLAGYEFPSVVSDVFFDAFSSFTKASAETQRHFEQNPGVFLDEWGLLNPPPDFFEPHEYVFVSLANEHSALLDREMKVDEDDIYSIREVHLPDRSVRILRLHPSPWTGQGRVLPRTPWIEMAKGPAGAIALLAPPNFLDPRYSWWLRTNGEQFGFKFARRRGAYSAFTSGSVGPSPERHPT